MQAKVNAESAILSPSSLISLYRLDGTAIGLSTIYYFCDGTNTNFKPVVFNGISYTPFPITMENNERSSQGQLPRPRVSLSNIRGFVSALLAESGGLEGATFTRLRVYARFLDAVNFQTPLPAWVTPDPTAAYAPEPFMVQRKVNENPQVVQFELSSPLELNNVQLPKRTIVANLCSWKYRQIGTCDFNGLPIADASNKPFGVGGYGLTVVDRGLYDASTIYNAGDASFIYSTLPQLSGIPIYYVCLSNGVFNIYPNSNPSTWAIDACSKTCAGCKLRFPITPMRTSAFPGTSRAGWISQR